MGTKVRMTVYAQQPDDEAFLAQVRREMDKRRRRRPLAIGLGFLLILLGLLAGLAVPSLLLQTFTRDVPAGGDGGGLYGEQSVRLALMGGLAVGAIAAVLVLLGVRLLSESRQGQLDRMAKMLLEQARKTVTSGPVNQ